MKRIVAIEIGSWLVGIEWRRGRPHLFVFNTKTGAELVDR